MTQQDRDSDFIERAAGPLRAPEHADAGFTPRTMAAVHAAAAQNAQRTGRRWWRRSWTVTITPLGALALAAGVALFAAGFGTLGRAPAGVVRADTVHVLRFVYVNGDADEVLLVGSFNAWSFGAMPLVRDPELGVWSVSVPLERGRHEYAFIVRNDRGEHWVADPLAPRLRDDFGTESSIVFIGT